MYKNMPYLNPIYIAYKNSTFFMVDGPKLTREHDVQVVDILEIQYVLTVQDLRALVLGGLLV